MPVAPGTQGGILAKYIVLQPTDPASIPNGSLALDATNSNTFTIKDSGGGVSVVSNNSENLLIKAMENLSGLSIAARRPVAKKTNGSVIDADSDGVGTQAIIGITLDTINDGEVGNVLLLGPNAANAILGLGFIVGKAVYVSPNGGYTTNTADFTLDNDITNDTIVRVGYADCPAGAASATATDLILFAGVESTT